MFCYKRNCRQANATTSPRNLCIDTAYLLNARWNSL